jgi:folate-dependent phosphoribosylglycinamide formyltransferase PurN
MKVAVLAPISSSLYSCLVTTLALQEKGVEVAAVIVRTPWSLKRFRLEFRRDGARLILKVFNKLILRDKSSSGIGNSLPVLAKRSNMTSRNLRDLCHIHHIPYLITTNHNSISAQKLLIRVQPDVIAFTGGGLLRREMLAISKLGVLNCHSGILPEYRGMDVVEWPIAEGQFGQVGLTLHFMDAGVDTGPILMQQTVNINKGETFSQLRTRMEPMMVEMMLTGLRGLRDGILKLQTQKSDDGQQYYVMHPRLKSYSENRLKKFK